MVWTSGPEHANAPPKCNPACTYSCICIDFGAVIPYSSVPPTTHPQTCSYFSHQLCQLLAILMHYCFILFPQVALSETDSCCHVLEERNAVFWRVRSATTGKDSKSYQIMTLLNSKASQWQYSLSLFPPFVIDRVPPPILHAKRMGGNSL